ncbi:unnamed protein product, partial [Polarella glacialis]
TGDMLLESCRPLLESDSEDDSENVASLNCISPGASKYAHVFFDLRHLETGLVALNNDFKVNINLLPPLCSGLCCPEQVCFSFWLYSGFVPRHLELSVDKLDFNRSARPAKKMVRKDFKVICTFEF